MQNDNFTKNNVFVCKLQGCCWEYSSVCLYFTNNCYLKLSLRWICPSFLMDQVCLDMFGEQSKKVTTCRDKVGTSEMTPAVKVYDILSCNARPSQLSFLCSHSSSSSASFSPHLFPALLLWLPVSSWPDAQPPLGSIPHPEPRGKRGIGGGERGGEGQMEGMKERTTAGLLI